MSKYVNSTPVASCIYFDNSSSSLNSENVNDALVELSNKLPSNFTVALSGISYIESTDLFMIPTNFQSITFGKLTLNGILQIQGDLWLA